MPEEYTWKKVEAGETWDFNENKELIGEYVGKDEDVGPNHSNIYNLKQEDGNVAGVWGCTVLDNRFKRIGIGNLVKIVYLGEVENEKTGRTYKNFDVFVGDL